MAKNAAAFFTGLAAGMQSAEDKKEKKARQDKLDARDDIEFQNKQEDRTREKRDRQALVDAGKTITVEEGANGVVKPDTMDNRDVGLPENAALPNGGLDTGVRVAGKVFPDRAAGEAAAAAANTVESRGKRVVAAMGGIDPLKALDLEQQQTVRSRETTKFTQEQTALAKKLSEEGVIDAVKALRSGDAAGMTAAFNKSGKFKIVGDVQVAPLERDIPGLGKVPTYNATFSVEGPNGTPVTKTVNSHDLSVSLMPYEKWYDLQHKDAVLKETGRHNLATEKINGDVAAAKIDAATARSDLARAKAAAEGKPVAITAKELEDANKAITTRMTEIYQPKEGMSPKERDELGRQRDKAASEAHGIYRINNQSGNVIDTGTASYAARLAADPKSLLQRSASDGNTYPGVMVNGVFVVTGPPLMKKDKKPAAPAPAAAPTAASRGLPRTLGDIPGAADTATRVSTGAELAAR